MSNLIKSVYFNVQQTEEKRVIDSDSHIQDYIPDFSPVQEEEGFVPIKLGVETLTEEQAEGRLLNESMFVGEKPVSESEPEVSEDVQQQAALIIEDAEREAERILSEAEAQAENFRNQAYEEGKKSGYEEGMVAARVQLQEKEQELVNREAQMVEEYQQQLESLEPAFVDVMAKLIHKITGILVEDKKDVLLYLIDQSIRQLEKPKSIVLRVSKEDVVMVSAHLEQLKASLAEGVELEVMEESTLTKNQCIIETDQKMMDCSLDAQLSNLTEQLKLLTYV